MKKLSSEELKTIIIADSVTSFGTNVFKVNGVKIRVTNL